MSTIRVERVASEPGDTGPVWESWCSEHPLPNGDTGTLHPTHALAFAAAEHHASTWHPAASVRPDTADDEAQP